jgi:plasmid stabilization system protein ParE
MHTLRITEPAEQDVRLAYEWWRDNRSAEQAERWYLGIREAIDSLRHSPDRCAFAIETHLLPQGIRQLNFGIGRRPTHRILYTISKGVVTILRVRHTAQDELRKQDIDDASSSQTTPIDSQ